MERYDERLELAPRDIVSRSIVAEMRRTGSRHVFLDMTALDAEFLRERFPKIDETCQVIRARHRERSAAGIARIALLHGRRPDGPLGHERRVPGLYAAGEVSCTGVHGANRLASNSLLEGLVFGARAGEAAMTDSGTRNADKWEVRTRRIRGSAIRNPRSLPPFENALSVSCGNASESYVIAASLRRAIAEFEQNRRSNLSISSRNFVTLASLVARAALWREESRGGHFRTDFPEQHEEFRVIRSSGSEPTLSERARRTSSSIISRTA